MKKGKFILPITVFALLLSFGLAACNNSGEESKPAQSAQQQKIKVTAADSKTKLLKGDTVQLSADVDGVTWESNKPEIASVSGTGLVTALTKGSASISASKDGYKAGSISITVDYPNITVTAADNKTSLLKGETVALTASESDVTWSSSNQSVATVANGVVTAVALGEATITASKQYFNDGTIVINVVRPEATATLHMEDADHFTSDGIWGTSYSGTMYGPGEESPVYTRSSGNASEGKCIAYMDKDDKEVLTFTSTKAIKAEMVLMMASRSSVSDLSTVMEVKLNNTAIDLAGKSFAGGGDTNTFVEFSFGEVDILKDTNVLDFLFLGSSPYMDDLKFYSDETDVTITVVPVPEKDPIELSQTSLSVAEGKTAQIECALTELSYRSANAAVATVSDTGLVTGVKAGSTTIYISKDGYKTAKLPVEVTEAEGVFVVSINGITGEGITTRTSQNLSEPNNYIIEEFPANAVGTLSFSVETAGSYKLFMRARASGGYNSTTTNDLATCMTVKVNGTAINPTGTVSGNSFTDYLLGEVTLEAGNATIEITCLTAVPTINLFRFIPVTAE